MLKTIDNDNVENGTLEIGLELFLIDFVDKTPEHRPNQNG